jgi:hypothetical protein
MLLMGWSMVLNYFFKRRLSVKILIGDIWPYFSKKFVSGRSDWESRSRSSQIQTRLSAKGADLLPGDCG